MQPLGPRTLKDGGGGGQSQRSSTFHQDDIIDRGTELWRQKFESDTRFGGRTKSQPQIQGRLPPRVLPQKSENASRGAITSHNRQPGQQPSSQPDPHQAQAHTIDHKYPKPSQPQSGSQQSGLHVSQPQSNQSLLSVSQSSLVQPSTKRPCITQTPGAGKTSRNHKNTHPPAYSTTKETFSHQMIRPQPNITPPQAHPIPPAVRATASSNNAIHLHQKYPPTPKYENSVPQRYVLRSARDNAHPAMKKHMKGDWVVHIPVDEEPYHLPELGKKGKYRAKNSCDQESQSLPETISSIKATDDESEVVRHFSSDERVADKTAGNDISVKYGAWCTQDSGKDTGLNVEEAKDSWGPNSCQDWIDSLPSQHPPVGFFLEKNVERHYECDVEPMNGFLMAPIDYPATHIDPRNKSNQQELARRLNGSSTLKSSAEFEKNKRQLRKHEKLLEAMEMPHVNPDWIPVENLLPVHQSTPPSAQPSTNLAPFIQNEISKDITGPMGHIDGGSADHRVRISCFLRPAGEADLPEILNIYNWEVCHGIQALDTQNLKLEDIWRIFSQCRSSRTPFIVAVAGTPAEAAARREIPAPPRPYQTYRTGPYQQWIPQTPQKDRILGFGFLTIPATGLAGDIQHNVCRFQARAHLYVDNESRCKGIGRALLNKLTRCCSIYSVDMGTYEWHDPDNSAVCDLPSFNPRNYSRLFVEIASRGKNDPETLWYSKFLETEGFLCVSTMDKVRKIGYEEEGKWLDNLVWQLDCQDPKAVHENHKNPYSSNLVKDGQ